MSKLLICPACERPAYTRVDYARVRVARLSARLSSLETARAQVPLYAATVRLPLSKKIASVRASIKRWKRELQRLGEGV